MSLPALVTVCIRGHQWTLYTLTSARLLAQSPVIIVVKSVKYRLDKWTVRWWKISWIGGLKGGITAVQSTCYVVSSVIPRGVRLGPVLFSVLLIT